MHKKLIILMYHRIGTGRDTITLSDLESHFKYIQAHFPVVTPGEPLQHPISIMLSFDDACCDFYFHIFPLLQKYALKAVLAVIPGYILLDTTLESQKRLSLPFTFAMQEDFFTTHAPFCTWKELQQMHTSNLITYASHSWSHPNITRPFINLHQELYLSQQAIQQHLSVAIDSFVYPFGKSNKSTHAQVLRYYKYAFRIGNAMNKSWDCSYPLTRVIADGRESLYFLESKLMRFPFLWKKFVL